MELTRDRLAAIQYWLKQREAWARGSIEVAFPKDLRGLNTPKYYRYTGEFLGAVFPKLRRGYVEPDPPAPAGSGPGPAPSPYAVLHNGAWIVPNEQCGWVAKDDGKTVWVECTDRDWGPPQIGTGEPKPGSGEGGDASPLVLALGLLGLAVLGTIALINWASKSPKTVSLEDFPEPGEDRIEVYKYPPSAPGRCRITLDTVKPMWLKCVDLQQGDEQSLATISTDGDRRAQSMDVPDYIMASPGARLVIGKAKWMGALTQMYALTDVTVLGGSDWLFRWARD